MAGQLAIREAGSTHVMPSKRRQNARGFTLIEAALATVIVGTGVLAMLAAQQAYHKKNDWAGRSGTAMLLANELRELTLVLPKHDPFTGLATLGPEAGETDVTNFDDLDDFAGPVVGGFGPGTDFDPPINALRQPIAGMPGWSQHIEVVSVFPDNLSSDVDQQIGSTDLMRVTVTVSYQPPNTAAPSTVSQLIWVVAD